MKKSKYFYETRLSPEHLIAAINRFTELIKYKGGTPNFFSLIVDQTDCNWDYEELSEFAAEYRRNARGAFVSIGASGAKAALIIHIWQRSLHVSFESATKGEIESVFEIIEQGTQAGTLPPDLISQTNSPAVFIGHGRSLLWKELKDHLQDKHGFKIEAYESGARAGHTIRDILEELSNKSDFAVLVLTAEDEQSDGKMRARENVVHECGLFQGRLGYARAVMLIEDGVEAFSNIAGVQYIPFSKGNIKEVFGEVVATLKREFGK